MPVAFETGNFESSNCDNVFERDKEYSKKFRTQIKQYAVGYTVLCLWTPLGG